MALDMKRIEPWRVMQRAESGYYGTAPHRANLDPTNWVPRALELRKTTKLSWRKIADALNAEGFKSKHGHALDAALILNNLHNKKATGGEG